MASMESAFGRCDDTVLHATIPFHAGFDLGGSPDVVTFSGYNAAKLHVTAELIGSEQIPNSMGTYELAIAHENEENWGISVICRLAYYTLGNPIDDGDTMDIGSATPDAAPVVAFLFRRIAEFNVLGKRANVICYIGITEPELDYSRKRGSKALVEVLGTDYLTTDLYRNSKL